MSDCDKCEELENRLMAANRYIRWLSDEYQKECNKNKGG